MDTSLNKYFGQKLCHKRVIQKVVTDILFYTQNSRNTRQMARRKRQALSRIANLEAPTKRRKTSESPLPVEGIPLGKENLNQSVRTLKQVRE